MQSNGSSYPLRAICQRLNQYQRVLASTLSFIRNPLAQRLKNRIHNKRWGYIGLIRSSLDKEIGARTKCPSSINSRKMTNLWLDEWKERAFSSFLKTSQTRFILHTLLHIYIILQGVFNLKNIQTYLLFSVWTLGHVWYKKNIFFFHRVSPSDWTKYHRLYPYN